MKKVALVQFWKYPQIGLMTLSSVLKKKKLETEVFIGFIEKKSLVQKIIDYDPDFIGFYSSQSEFKWTLNSINDIKKKINPKIIVGGAYSTLAPEKVIKHKNIDFVCVGESENSTSRLIENVLSNKSTTNISGIWTKKNNKIIKQPPGRIIKNLDDLPFPDWTIYEKYKKKMSLEQLFVMTSRGCPYECTFCIEPNLKRLYNCKNYYRRKSVDYVIREIQQASQFHKFRYVRFFDSTFTLNKKWVLEFAKKYQEQIKIPYAIVTRLDQLDDDIVSALKRSGCFLVGVGIETANEKIRNKELKKNLSDEAIYKGISLLKKYKIKIHSFNMISLPNEKKKDMLNTLRLNKKINPDYVYFFFFQPFYGLKEYKSIESKIKNLKDYRKDVTYFETDKVYVTNLGMLSFLIIKIPFMDKIFPPLLDKFPVKLSTYLFKSIKTYEKVSIKFQAFVTSIKLKNSKHKN